MARNLEIGIHRAVSAKLRERGMSQQSADAMATKNLSAAVAYFNAQLRKHDHAGLTETSYEETFADLAQWTAALKV